MADSLDVKKPKRPRNAARKARARARKAAKKARSGRRRTPPRGDGALTVMSMGSHAGPDGLHDDCPICQVMATYGTTHTEGGITYSTIESAEGRAALEAAQREASRRPDAEVANGDELRGYAEAFAFEAIRRYGPNPTDDQVEALLTEAMFGPVGESAVLN